MTEYIEKLNWMKPIIPAHTSHNYEAFWLAIMLNNQAFYSDCVQTMDENEID